MMDLSPFGLSPFPDTPPDLSETLPLDGARDLDESVPLAERFVHCLAQARLDRIHVRDFPEFVADGGTFVVAKCNITNIGAVVVKKTKFSIPENTVDDYTLVRRLRTILREVSILTLPQIRGNDYIINIFGWDWNASDDESSRGVSPVLVMEYAALGSLDAFLSTGSYGASMKLLWCYQVCSALSSLHNSGVIHGDVKPENVLVCEKDGEIVVKVADFGNSLFETSSEGSYCCTQAYAAPELSHGHTLSRPALKLCDIFSFGLLVWEAILDGKHYKEGSHDWEQDDEEMSEGESVVESMGVTDDGDDGDDSLGNRATETRLRGALRACARIKAEAERSQFQAIFLQTLQEDPRLRIQSIQGLERELQRSFSYPE
jgi:serine/threonine protein kinase